MPIFGTGSGNTHEPPVATLYHRKLSDDVVGITVTGTNGPMNWQYCVPPVTAGAGGVVVTRTESVPRKLSQLPIFWVAHTRYNPTIVVGMTGAVVVDTPPTADGYQSTVEVGNNPVTVNG